ncbi:chloride channel [Scenedesmus sp. NREL 46B-D3]|nr:chloride channel [Scenedesmus sp. NREL 46B-D3]
MTKVFGTKNAPNQRVSESLDYEPVQNKIFYERMKAAKKERHLFGYTGHTLAKFIITMVSGILTGFFAVWMSKTVGTMFEWKNGFVQELLDEEGEHRVFIAYLWHAAYSCLLVSFAVALVQYWAPQAAGAGVTLVMAYLNGNHVPNLLRLRTLITKFVGTCCSVSAGLPMGPEGPMVHIGACLASVITYAECTCIRTGRWLSCFGKRAKSREAQIMEKMKVLDDIVSDSDHREFVSAGTAAGISAAFGAPIGGVLFAMEEACSFWNRKTSWRCFLAAVCATFTLQTLSKNAAHGMISFTGVHNYENRDWLMQLPFILINAGVAGLLGAAFNSMRMWLWKLRASKTRHVLRIAEVIGLALMCTTCGFFFAWSAGKCIPKNPEWGEEYGIKFLCEEGEHNDLATLFLSSSHHTIVNLFSMGHNPGEAYVVHFTQGSLVLFVVVYLILMSVGAGVAIPGGLFMPSIMVGAAWGGLWGSALRDWLQHWNIQPGVYGVMAASSVLAGVFRSNVSLVVLVMEGTRGIEFMFGIILSVVVANWVAHHIHHDGVYESELQRIGNLYFLRDEAPHRLHTLTAEMIMATGVVGFRPVESVANVLAALHSTTHNGFPIAFTPEGAEVGPIVRSGLGAGVGAGSHGSLVSLAQLGATQGRKLQGVSTPEPGSPGPAATGPVATALGEVTAAAAVGAAAAEQQAAAAGVGGSSAAGGAVGGGVVATCEGGRLEGVILRSQLLVLLQRRHFCDQHGRPVGREYSEKEEIDLETEMRTFFRRYFTHNRYVSATATPLEALQLQNGSVDLGSLFIDMRPYMNRSPFTVRRDCSASRAHQAFVLLGLRHLIIVDAQNRIVGICTRKDLDHAAGHGWWRMSAQAPKPRRHSKRPAPFNSFLRHIPSVPNFLTKLVNKEADGSPARAAAAAAAAAGEQAPYEVDEEEEQAAEHERQGLRGSGDGGSDGEESREPSGFFRAFRAGAGQHSHSRQQHGAAGSSSRQQAQPREQASIAAAGSGGSATAAAGAEGLHFGPLGGDNGASNSQLQQQPGSRGLY